MAESEFKKILEGLQVDSKLYVAILETDELKKRRDEIQTQLEALGKTTYELYSSKVEELKKQQKAIREEQKKCEEELEEKCKELCDMEVHCKTVLMFVTPSIERSSRNVRHYTATCCPICGKFIKASYVYNDYKKGRFPTPHTISGVSEKEFFSAYKIAKDNETFTYSRIAEHLDEISHSVKSIIEVSEDQKVVDIAKRIIELIEKINELKNSDANITKQFKDLCDTFGHDTQMPYAYDSTVTCRCCGKRLYYSMLIESYKAAPIHGLIGFEYAKYDYIKPKKFIEYEEPRGDDRYYYD